MSTQKAANAAPKAPKVKTPKAKKDLTTSGAAKAREMFLTGKYTMKEIENATGDTQYNVFKRMGKDGYEIGTTKNSEGRLIYWANPAASQKKAA